MQNLSIERSNQGRSLMSTAVLVDIIRTKLLRRIVVILGCLGEGRLLGWFSKLTKDRGSSCKRILSLLLLQLLQLCEVKRIRSGEVTVGMDGWRRRRWGTRHIARVAVRALVGMSTGELGRGRSRKEQLFYHPLVLVHIVHIAISRLSVVEVGLINTILPGPARAGSDTGTSAPIACDHITGMASSPLRPRDV